MSHVQNSYVYKKLVEELDREIEAFKVVQPDTPLYQNLELAHQIRNIIEGKSSTHVAKEVLFILAVHKDAFYKKWGVGVMSENLRLADNLSKYLIIN